MTASLLPGLIHFMIYVWWEFSALSYFSFFSSLSLSVCLFKHWFCAFSLPGIYKIAKTQLCPGEALSLAGQTEGHRSDMAPGAVRCGQQGYLQRQVMEVRATSFLFLLCTSLLPLALCNYLGTIQHCYQKMRKTWRKFK